MVEDGKPATPLVLLEGEQRTQQAHRLLLGGHPQGDLEAVPVGIGPPVERLFQAFDGCTEAHGLTGRHLVLPWAWEPQVGEDMPMPPKHDWFGLGSTAFAPFSFSAVKAQRRWRLAPR